MIKLYKKIDLSGYTVIIPSIAVGNVAQLSVDLVIATLQMKRCATIWHPALMPIFGPPAYQHDSESKTTSCDLYVDENKKLLAFQFRAPFVSSELDSFLEELRQFLIDQKIKEVLILTSSHAYEKHIVGTTPFEYLANDSFRKMWGKVIANQKWAEFGGTLIHGGGTAQKLLNVCTENDIPALILMKFVSEGDNSIDAKQLLMELNNICNLFDDKIANHNSLIIPISWNFLFGNDSPEMIF